MDDDQNRSQCFLDLLPGLRQSTGSMGTCMEVAIADMAFETQLGLSARHHFSVPLKARLCVLRTVCFSQCISVLFMVSLISYLNLSNCHCCNYILLCYFSTITSCLIHHRHWHYFVSFLFTTIWIHRKDDVVSALRLPFSLSSSNSFSCNFWLADLPCSTLLVYSWLFRVHLGMCWRYCLTVLKQAGLPHVFYPVRDFCFLGVSVLTGGLGKALTLPTCQGGGQHFPACNRDSENISHPNLSSYLFHCITCSSKGDFTPRDLFYLLNWVMPKSSSVSDGTAAVLQSSFQNSELHQVKQMYCNEWVMINCRKRGVQGIWLKDWRSHTGQ